MATWLFKPVAAVSAIAVTTLGLLSTKYEKARFYLNLGLYSGTLGVWSVWGVVVSILATAVGHVSCPAPRWRHTADDISDSIRITS
jgi:lysophosphatidate acyltransferase